MSALVLTERDARLLAYLAAHRECPVDLLAERFFAANPYTGVANKSPGRLCARRIAQLRRHGFVDTLRLRERAGAREVVVLAGRADQVVGEGASRRRVPNATRSHHARTLDAIGLVRRDLARRGGRLVDFRVEAELRRAAMGRRRTRRGDAFCAFPDAECSVRQPGAPGAPGTAVTRVAVEYVTAKYSDEDIRLKHEGFSLAYAGTLWFADNARTAARVTRLVGAPCSVLS
ncbi:MAG: hypothetical protein HYS27_03140 [Deltaproteobacteria bacterium]|nr:hypothetical protein [Deltaproteobacteria bacterium]